MVLIDTETTIKDILELFYIAGAIDVLQRSRSMLLEIVG
jgi:hypothetical protein